MEEENPLFNRIKNLQNLIKKVSALKELSNS